MAAALLALALGSAFLLFGGWAERFGAHLPVVDAAGDYAAALIWASFLGLTIALWPVPESDKAHLLALWIAKIVVVLVPMLFYEAHYSVLDAYTYYAVAQAGYQWTPFELAQGTENVYRLVWLHGWIAPDSYHATKATFALVGLVAIYLFYRAAVLYLGRRNTALLYALALFPSILFWSSILGKDPVVLLGIALCAYGVLASWHRGRWVLLPVLTGLAVLAYVRVWMVAILLVALLPLLLSSRWGIGRRLVAFTGIAVAGAAVAWTVADMYMLVDENLPGAIGRISQAWADDGGSGQRIAVDFSSFSDLVRFAPIGMFTALFRPLIGEVPNAFGLLAGLENAVLLAFALFALIRLRASDLGEPVILSALLVIGLWAGVYGFLSYQNLGTAVRFKVQVLPVVLCLLIHLCRRRRLRFAGWIRGGGTFGVRPC